jgi:hypothetical protein
MGRGGLHAWEMGRGADGGILISSARPESWSVLVTARGTAIARVVSPLECRCLRSPLTGGLRALRKRRGRHRGRGIADDIAAILYNGVAIAAQTMVAAHRCPGTACRSRCARRPRARSLDQCPRRARREGRGRRRARRRASAAPEPGAVLGKTGVEVGARSLLKLMAVPAGMHRPAESR